MERISIGALAQYHVEQVIYQNIQTNRAFYKIKSPSLGMHYGLKVIELTDKREARIVKNEITALNRLPFGMSAKCHQYWQEGDKHFLLMDWVEGQALSDVFSIPPQSKQEVAQRLSVAEKVTLKLSQLHRLKMLHRDIKPENIVVQMSGGNVHSASLIDFGLANQKRGLEEGTYQYQSPEQGFTRYVGLSEASDAFSVCQVIVFLLTGQPLNLQPNFDSTDWDEAVALKLPEGCPDKLNITLKKGLAFNPKKRIRNTSSIISELKNALRQINRRG